MVVALIDILQKILHGDVLFGDELVSGLSGRLLRQLVVRPGGLLVAAHGVVGRADHLMKVAMLVPRHADGHLHPGLHGQPAQPFHLLAENILLDVAFQHQKFISIHPVDGAGVEHLADLLIADLDVLISCGPSHGVVDGLHIRNIAGHHPHGSILPLELFHPQQEGVSVVGAGHQVGKSDGLQLPLRIPLLIHVCHNEGYGGQEGYKGGKFAFWDAIPPNKADDLAVVLQRLDGQIGDMVLLGDGAVDRVFWRFLIVHGHGHPAAGFQHVAPQLGIGQDLRVGAGLLFSGRIVGIEGFVLDAHHAMPGDGKAGRALAAEGPGGKVQNLPHHVVGGGGVLGIADAAADRLRVVEHGGVGQILRRDVLVDLRGKLDAHGGSVQRKQCILQQKALFEDGIIMDPAVKIAVGQLVVGAEGTGLFQALDDLIAFFALVGLMGVKPHQLPQAAVHIEQLMGIDRTNINAFTGVFVDIP